MVMTAPSGISSVVNGAAVFLGCDCCCMVTRTLALLPWKVCVGLSWDKLVRTLDARLRSLHFPGSHWANQQMDWLSLLWAGRGCLASSLARNEGIASTVLCPVPAGSVWLFPWEASGTFHPGAGETAWHQPIRAGGGCPLC